MLRHSTMIEVDYRGTLYAASMARDLLWEGENNIDLDDFVRSEEHTSELQSRP